MKKRVQEITLKRVFDAVNVSCSICLLSFGSFFSFSSHCENFLLLYNKCGRKENSSLTACMQGNSVSQINIRKPFYFVTISDVCLSEKKRTVLFSLLPPWVERCCQISRFAFCLLFVLTNLRYVHSYDDLLKQFQKILY